VLGALPGMLAAQATLEAAQAKLEVEGLVALATLQAALAQTPPARPAPAAKPVPFAVPQADRAADRESRLYDAGRRALDRNQFQQALEAFNSVVEIAGSRADGALYWKAYTLYRLAQRSEALEALTRLPKAHPQSRWIEAARALEVEVRQASGQPVSADAQHDEELALLVVQNLLHSNPERAVPTLEKVLQGNQTPRVKERALFVLSQSRAPQARDMIAQFARGKAGHPDLQLQAIRYVGLTGQESAAQILGEIYRSSADVEVKRAIIESLMLGNQRGQVVAIARREPHVVLRNEAVQKLGLMEAQTELWDLYARESDVELKKQIIRALAMGRASDRLLDLARTEKNPELRAEAIRRAGMVKSDKSAALLTEIYATDKDVAVRKQVIEALFIQQNASALVKLARAESDPAMKKELVQRLSLMKSPEATDYLIEILKIK
jgi:tetratricopeptide (TPR) repeat protein